MVVFNEKDHTYINSKGKILISTTQLLAKHGLTPDYSEVDKEVLENKAKRGTAIHKEIEDYNKTGEVGFTNEVINYANNDIVKTWKCVESEKLVNYKDLLAGTLDGIISDQNGDLYLIDYKTTYDYHIDTWEWQLSLYRFMYGYDKIKGLKVVHFNKEGKIDIIDINSKTKEQIKKLLECEKEGKLYKQEMVNTLELCSQLNEIEKTIQNIENDRKIALARQETLKNAIMQAMEQNGVKTFENDNLKITYVAPTTRVSIDTKKLKEDNPDLVKKYERFTRTKSSLRITMKGNK